jgi:hypothetical protein
VPPPAGAVAGLVLRHTTEASATVAFSALAASGLVTSYLLEISTDGAAWHGAVPGVELPETAHRPGTLTATASGLGPGPRYSPPPPPSLVLSGHAASPTPY